jgi:hypothetical protein
MDPVALTCTENIQRKEKKKGDCSPNLNENVVPKYRR